MVDLNFASLFGILLGAIGLRGLSDNFIRERMFVVKMSIAAFPCLLAQGTLAGPIPG